MGIFDKPDIETKATERERKRLALEQRAASDAEKEEKNATAKLEKVGLNLGAYDIDTIRQKNLANIKSIVKSQSLAKFEKALTFGKPADIAMVNFLGAMVEQNWILIRQQEQVIRLLEKV